MVVLIPDTEFVATWPCKHAPVFGRSEIVVHLLYQYKSCYGEVLFPQCHKVVFIQVLFFLSYRVVRGVCIGQLTLCMLLTLLRLLLAIRDE